MFYNFSFTIPANTLEASPYTEKVKLTYGIIHRVEIGFPDGCANLVHLQIKHKLHQAWPTNPDGSFSSNNYNIPFNEYYPFITRPYILTLHGWNLDDTYNHTLQVRIGILPVEVLMPEESFVAAFKQLLKRLRL